jgi:hypothetical protein
VKTRKGPSRQRCVSLTAQGRVSHPPESLPEARHVRADKVEDTSEGDDEDDPLTTVEVRDPTHGPSMPLTGSERRGNDGASVRIYIQCLSASPTVPGGSWHRPRRDWRLLADTRLRDGHLASAAPARLNLPGVVGPAIFDDEVVHRPFTRMPSHGTHWPRAEKHAPEQGSTLSHHPCLVWNPMRWLLREALRLHDEIRDATLGFVLHVNTRGDIRLGFYSTNRTMNPRSSRRHETLDHCIKQ